MSRTRPRRTLRPLRALVVAALRTDLRTRDPLGGRISRSTWGLVSGLVFYVLVGACLALFMSTHVPLRVQVVTYLGVAALYVAFNIWIEYQNILLAPEDHDVVGWRPVASRTLLVARCLHVLVYVCMLSAALLVVPALVLSRAAAPHGVAMFAGFVGAALLNTLAATSLAIGIYALVLRIIPAARFKKALTSVQVFISLALILGYQLVGPVFERVDPQHLARPPAWFEWLPATWFANLPLAAAGHAASWLSLLGGALGVAVGAALAARWIGPGYTAQLGAVEVAEGERTPAPTTREGVLRRAFTRALARHPLQRAGLRFFLSNLHGDRRLYAALVQVMTLPLVLVAMGLVFGETADPYAAATDPVAFREGLGSGAARDAPGAFALFAAAYLLAMMVPTTTRLLKSSLAWRAAWVVFASPTRHYDRFYSGVLLGVVYGLVLPATALLVAVLLLLWRDAFHVLAHLALPLGTALVAFPILLRFDVQVPFSCAPARHERTRELFRVVTTLVPIGLVAYVHAALTARPLLLVALGASLCVIGASAWPLVARRARALPHGNAFDG